jgi:lathosterol oxidase
VLLFFAFVTGSIAASMVILYGLGGAIHLHYHVLRRTRAAEWKHQPDAWIAPSVHRAAMRLGAGNLTLAAALSGGLAYYVYRGGYTTLYFDLHRHSLVYNLLSPLFVFAVIEALAYYTHRSLHWKPLYKAIHKWHHRYTTSTAFVTTAMHPAEQLFYEAVLVLPMFVIPVYYLSYLGVVLLVYGMGIFYHSGIKAARFHDDHHKHPRCNYGQSSPILDWLNGTLRAEAQ